MRELFQSQLSKIKLRMINGIGRKTLIVKMIQLSKPKLQGPFTIYLPPSFPKQCRQFCVLLSRFANNAFQKQRSKILKITLSRKACALKITFQHSDYNRNLQQLLIFPIQINFFKNPVQGNNLVRKSKCRSFDLIFIPVLFYHPSTSFIICYHLSRQLKIHTRVQSSVHMYMTF